MKPSYEELEQKLAESQREFRAADATIENLQMQVENLAAENAFLKGVVSGINNELYGQGFMVSGWHLNGALEPLDNWFTDNGWGEPETPATDAFLAEVRAQAKADGVQEYADSFRHSASKIRECHGDTIRVRALLHEANNADEFAALLRKGVQSCAKN